MNFSWRLAGGWTLGTRTSLGTAVLILAFNNKSFHDIAGFDGYADGFWMDFGSYFSNKSMLTFCNEYDRLSNLQLGYLFGLILLFRQPRPFDRWLFFYFQFLKQVSLRLIDMLVGRGILVQIRIRRNMGIDQLRNEASLIALPWGYCGEDLMRLSEYSDPQISKWIDDGNRCWGWSDWISYNESSCMINNYKIPPFLTVELTESNMIKCPPNFPTWNQKMNASLRGSGIYNRLVRTEYRIPSDPSFLNFWISFWIRRAAAHPISI